MQKRKTKTASKENEQRGKVHLTLGLGQLFLTPALRCPAVHLLPHIKVDIQWPICQMHFLHFFIFDSRARDFNFR